MSLTDFRSLGRSGLIVSPLALGTMTFGAGRWGADEATARSIFDAYRAAGGHFADTADTADVDAGGGSERLVGKFIAGSGARDEIVLATKFAFNGSGGGNPNAGGAGAKNIHRALDASLRRLDADRMDRLDAASAPVAGFGAGLTTPSIRRMVFGGHDVTGWGE